jgi:hypothetical protein
MSTAGVTAHANTIFSRRTSLRAALALDYFRKCLEKTEMNNMRDEEPGNIRRKLRARFLVTPALGICLAALGAALTAQEPHLRPPTPAENVVLNHYRDVMHSVLDTFQSDDWDQSVDFDVQDDVFVSNDPDVPLDINEMMQRTYTVRQDSALYQREFAPIVDKLNSTQDVNEMQALSKQLPMTKYSVEVHFNVLSEGVKPPPSANPDLHIPGTALAYRVENYKFDQGTSVVLLFGDWKSATWQPTNKWYRYRFQHAFRQPAIENVVIQLDGSPERIDELLRTVNWQAVNGAITH